MPEPELLDAGPSEKGWSRIQMVTACPQLYAYRHVLRVPLPVSEPLIRGSLGHVGLAHWYRRLKAWREEEDPDRWYAPLDAMRILAERNGPAWLALLDLATRAVQTYVAHHGSREPLRILAVEEQIATEIGGHRYTQRVDMIAERPDGTVIYVDHKFVSRIGSKEIDRYTLSGQFLGLRMFGLAREGARFGGVVLNLVGMTGGKEADGGFAFRRAHPGLAPWALECHGQAVIDAEAEIARLVAEGRDPWRWPKRLNEAVCWTMYGPCAAFDLCRFGPPGSG